MLTALLLSLALAHPARPLSSADDARPRALVLDLVGDAVSEQTRKSITGLVVVKLAKIPRLDVVSGQEAKGLANLEADKQAAGCDDSCLADIAGAMDARLVVSGFVGKLGSLTVVNLSLFDAQKATAVGRATVEAESIEDLPNKLGPAIDEMLKNVPKVKPRARVPDDVDAAPPYAAMGLVGGGAVVAVVGVVLGVFSGVLYGDANTARTELDDANKSFDGDTNALAGAHDTYVAKRDTYNSTGVALAWSSVAGVVVGVGAAVAGAALWAHE